MFVDGGAFFVATAWLPAIVHGIIMHNPTLEEYGDFKLLPRDEVTQVLDTAKVQTQRRVDFTVLAQENIALDNIRSGMVRRFVKFCQENKVVANLNLDSTMTRAEMVHLTPDNPLGPVAVLSAPFFDDYFKSFRMHAASDGKRKSDEPWHKALLHEVLVFAKTLGHEVDPASLQEPFAILREKHKHSGNSFTFPICNNSNILQRMLCGWDYWLMYSTFCQQSVLRKRTTHKIYMKRLLISLINCN